MSTFDDILESAKNAASQAGKFAGQVIDGAKLKLSQAEVEREINKCYTALGRKVYESAKNGEDAQAFIDEQVGAIDALKARLEELVKEEADSKNKKVCQGCGEFIPVDARFCPKCGADTQPVQAKPEKPSGTETESSFVEDFENAVAQEDVEVTE